MRVSILGKFWDLQYRRLRGRQWGYCEPPDAPGKRIVLDRKLSGQKELEILIHELLHAALWFVCEDVVKWMARDIARVLWRRGYRLK